MPGITTSAITYRRGISNSTPNFFLVAQANYVIPQPTNRFRINNTSIAPPQPPPPPPTAPSAPTITSITPGDQTLSLNFTPPTSDGGSSITNYQYSIDGGINYTSVAQVASPITISGLTNGTTYPLRLRAVNLIGIGDESNILDGTPVSPTTFTFSGFQPITTTSSTISESTYLIGGRTKADLIDVSIGTTCTTIADECFNFFDVTPKKLQSVTFLGNSVTTIGKKAFAYNNGGSSFSTITLPSSVTSLGENCFLYCVLNGIITIPKSVTSLGQGCFEGCQAIDEINFESGSTITSLPFNGFSACSQLTLINIPASVTTIGPYCFQSCLSLSTGLSFESPASVTSFGGSCFAYCSGLTSLSFVPLSVTQFGPNCFFQCTGFVSLQIPSSIQFLGFGCFQNCSNITSIIIPSSVTNIQGKMMDNCSSLTSLTFNNPNNISVNIPTGSNGILTSINNTVVVTFNGVSNWYSLNTFVTNYFTGPIAPSGPPNYPTNMSYNFVPWSALNSGLDGPANALVKTSNALYVGGYFSTAGGVAVSNIAKWNGSSWSSVGQGVFGSGPYYGPNVYALAEDSGGNIYVGGEFAYVKNTDGTFNFNADRIAKWDGSSWSALASGVGASNSQSQVNSIATSGTDVYVGGTFNIIGVQSINRIAKWNGSSWSPLKFGADNDVNAIAVLGSDVYIGGAFLYVYNDVPFPIGPGAVLANRIAKWDTTTSLWSALGTGVNGTVYAIAILGSDIYIGGTFTTAGGVSANNIAKWDTTTSSWSALGTGVISTVNSITISGSDIYVGGTFTTAGGVSVNNIAKWDTTTSSWSALGTGTNDTVKALDIMNSELYLGGIFTTAGGVTVNRVAVYNI